MWGGGVRGCPVGFRGLLITTGILTSWHQGNVIPQCLCNPEKLHSKETLSVSQPVSQSVSQSVRRLGAVCQSSLMKERKVKYSV